MEMNLQRKKRLSRSIIVAFTLVFVFVVYAAIQGSLFVSGYVNFAVAGNLRFWGTNTADMGTGAGDSRYQYNAPHIEGKNGELSRAGEFVNFPSGQYVTRPPLSGGQTALNDTSLRHTIYFNVNLLEPGDERHIKFQLNNNSNGNTSVSSFNVYQSDGITPFSPPFGMEIIFPDNIPKIIAGETTSEFYSIIVIWQAHDVWDPDLNGGEGGWTYIVIPSGTYNFIAEIEFRID